MIIGDSSSLQENTFETIIMTANVAQLFLTEDSWYNTNSDAYHALKSSDHFIFDTRNPLAKAWEQ